MSVTHPEFAREYSSKNSLPSDKVLIGARKKFWWACSKCKHEWQATGTSRTHGSGCPKCNSLAATHPELAKEYSDRNELPADQIVAGSNKRLWWKCSTCGHEWQTSGSLRTYQKTKCPLCAKKIRSQTRRTGRIGH